MARRKRGATIESSSAVARPSKKLKVQRQQPFFSDDEDWENNQAEDWDNNLAEEDAPYRDEHDDSRWNSNCRAGGWYDKSRPHARAWAEDSNQGSRRVSNTWSNDEQRKVQSAPRRATNDDVASNFCVKLSGVPIVYDHDTLIELHESTGLDVKRFESSKFEAPTAGDEYGTCSVICRYSDKGAAQRALRELNGQIVVDEHDTEKILGARLYESQGPSEILPSVYISDLPANVTEDDLRNIHMELGVEGDSLVSVKFLASKDPSKETCCCIGRYQDEGTALLAIERLKGFKVQTVSGVWRFLGARMAKPASWMVQTGQADRQMQMYQEMNDQSAYRAEQGGRCSSVASQRRRAKGNKFDEEDTQGEDVQHTNGHDDDINDHSSGSGVENRSKSQGPSEILPSVYISDLPVNVTVDDLRVIHAELGVDSDGLVSVKFLASKDPSKETCCCIGRYQDEGTAQLAIDRLKGYKIQTASGVWRFLGARMAKPASWMMQTGYAGRQMYLESNNSHQWVNPTETATRFSAGGETWSKAQIVPRRVANDDLASNFCIKLAGVPVSYDHDTLIELHENSCLDVTRFRSSSFEAPTDKDEHGTCTVICRYSDKAAAQNAAQDLDGQVVADEHDNDKVLSASLCEIQPPTPIMPKKQGPSEILPSVYISDLPVHIMDDDLRNIHMDLGVDVSKFVSMKFLATKDPSKETRCCIGRYQDEETAQFAIDNLNGYQLQTASGAWKFIGAKMAKPASWMPHTDQHRQTQVGREDRKPVFSTGELPIGENVSGKIKSWFADKAFGYIACEGGPDVFLHITDVVDGTPPSIGDRVTFRSSWEDERSRYRAEECVREDNCSIITRKVPSVSEGIFEEEARNLHVKGLPEQITEDDIADMFTAHGEVHSCTVLYRKPGETAAIVRMCNAEDALQAIEGFNGLVVDGATWPLVVTKMKKKPQR